MCNKRGVGDKTWLVVVFLSEACRVGGHWSQVSFFSVKAEMLQTTTCDVVQHMSDATRFGSSW